MLDFRRAEAGDSDDILAWRNDPVAVETSLTRSPVAPDDHARWYASVLSSPDRVLVLATEGGAKAPWISLDRAGELVREKFPDLSPDFVGLPSNAFGHILVGGRGAYPLIFETANVNPYNGKIEATRRVSDRSVLELVTESAVRVTA